MGGTGGGRRKKLIEGVRVLLFYPAWSASCQACLQFARGIDGVFKYDAKNQPIRRPPGVPTPCRQCPKVPDSAKTFETNADVLRSLANELTTANRRAYAAYRQFRAVGSFPDDAIVRWYAVLIRDVEDTHDRYLKEKRSLPLELIAEVLKVRYAR